MEHCNKTTHFPRVEPGDATVYNLTIIEGTRLRLRYCLVYFGIGTGDSCELVDTFRFKFLATQGVPCQEIYHTIQKSNIRGEGHTLRHEAGLLCGLLGAYMGYPLDSLEPGLFAENHNDIAMGFEWMTKQMGGEVKGKTLMEVFEEEELEGPVEKLSYSNPNVFSRPRGGE